MTWTPLQKKIFVLVVSLFSLVYVLTLISVYSAAYNQAEREFNTRLNVGRNVFLNEMTVAKANFDSNVETIAKDWALRSAVGQGIDGDSIVSIVANHGNRIGADAALIVNNKFETIALYSKHKNQTFSPEALNLDSRDKQLAWMSVVGDKVFMLSAEPIKAPNQIGWLIMGKMLDADFMERIKRLISLDINLLVSNDHIKINPLSTMESAKRGQYWLNRDTMDLKSFVGKIDTVEIAGEELIVLPFMLAANDQFKFIIILQDSISESLKSFNTFLLELVPYFIFGVLLAVLGSYYIARSITRPVGRLLEAAKRVASGHYTEHIRVSEKSELGELASEFTHMQDAVMARERKIKEQAEEIKQANKSKFEVVIANKKKQMAEEATKAKSRFLANVSHEIRTPLNALIGYSEMLTDDKVSVEKRENAVNAINSGGRHLLSIVNDVLDVSKIEADKIDLEHIDINLKHLLEEVKSNMQGLAQEKGIQFTLDLHFPLPAYFNSDPTRLKQILFNLCNNAIKFTEKGEVGVSVYLNQFGRQLQFDVRDTGLGMTQKQQQKLFAAFSQADQSTSRKFGGTGLGLYISKELIDLLGGSIEVNSELGAGSTFSVFLPWEKAQNSTMLLDEKCVRNDVPATQKVANDAPNLAASILCADDNEDNRILLEYLLGKTGAKLHFVENGKQAVETALANTFDLILMDMQMPEMDGLEATKLLKSAGFSQPIIMLTANVDEASKKQVYAAGADGHIGKPFDTQVLYNLLEKHINESRQEDEFIEPSADNFARLVTNYTNGLGKRLEQIMQAKEDNNWELLKQDIHKLKGSAGNFGFPDISKIAAEVEDFLSEDNYLMTEDKLNQLGDVIHQVVSEANQC